MSANSTSAKVIKTVCKVFVGAIKFKERRHMFRLELLTRLRHLSFYTASFFLSNISELRLNWLTRMHV